MTMVLSLAQLKSYIWVYWCLADGATGRSTAETKRERQRRTEAPERSRGKRNRSPARGAPQLDDDGLTSKLREVLMDEGTIDDRVIRFREIVEEETRITTSPDTDDTVQELLTSFRFPDAVPAEFRRRSAIMVTKEDEPLGLSGFMADN